MAEQSSSCKKVTMGPPVEPGFANHCQFRAFTLANELNVLLISDSATEKAAVAMDVGVGYFSDPPELPGLAHYLEHMIFQGTRQYPQEGSFLHFVKSNGGEMNGCTSEEHTNYHFFMVVGNNDPSSFPKFREALDRFSSNFKTPLFTKSAMEGEAKAVDGEFELDASYNEIRFEQVLKCNVNPAHPFSNFGIGSKKSLSEDPFRKGIDTRARLIAFYQKHYSANLMNLCVIAPYSLDQIQESVVDIFSTISNHNASDPAEAYIDVPPFLPAQCASIIYIVPKKREELVKITWVVPSCVKEYRSDPMQIITNLFDDTDVGSFGSVIESRGWGKYLGLTHIDAKSFGLLSLSMRLLNGMNHFTEIITILFQYVQKIRAREIPNWFFEEEKITLENKNKYVRRADLLDWAAALSSHMHFRTPEEYVIAGQTVKEFAPNKVEDILDHMTPESAIITLTGQSDQWEGNRQEPWYGSEYTTLKIPESIIEEWQNPEDDENFRSLRFPSENPYIATDFSIVENSCPHGLQSRQGPHRILSDGSMDVHYLVYPGYNGPLAFTYFLIESPLSYQSPWHYFMLKLLIATVMDSSGDIIGATTRAGIHCQIYPTTIGLLLRVDGFSHRLDKVILEIIKRISYLDRNPDRVWLSFTSLVANLNLNEDLSPVQIARTCRQTLLSEPHWESREEMDCVKDVLARIKDEEKALVIPQELKQFSEDFLRRMYVTVLGGGNLTEDSLIKTAKSVKERLGFRALPYSERRNSRVVRIPLRKDVFSRQNYANLQDKSSAINVLYQFEPGGDSKDRVRIELLCKILEAPVETAMRTVQQLGYHIHVGKEDVLYMSGLCVEIESTVASPDELLRRIDQFMAEARTTAISQMSEQTFQSYVEALRNTLNATTKELLSLSSVLFKELRNLSRQNYLQKLQDEIDALRNVTRDDILQIFDDCIAPDGCKRRRLVVQVFGKVHPFADREPIPNAAIEVVHPSLFKNRCALYAIPE